MEFIQIQLLEHNIRVLVDYLNDNRLEFDEIGMLTYKDKE